ncbi:hypothetical protein QBC37DRAFT_379629 [Rhypophila decipiens]|uniref:Uncharacterized protein n=1 Tax=Rhypophila decipiens TaxID=261697 RepID=A0AAN6XWC5_9PEZI|nr:hypothetical protein QBC37DRAFT_379629 [Rhypophila decipiens]
MTATKPTVDTKATSPADGSSHQQSPDRDLTKDLTSPTSPSTEHSAADAQRAMESTGAWQPSFTRRQSWSQQEYKHVIQMSKVNHDQPDMGFTERT